MNDFYTRHRGPYRFYVVAKVDVRICFALAWFKTEAEAKVFAEEVEKSGATYNGGFYHGMTCGRDKSWDYKDEELGQLYAVTF